MKFEKASDIQEMAEKLLDVLDFGHINEARIICMRSFGSNANAYARIWNFPKIWQEALEVKPFYVIEVLSEEFDKLSIEDKEKVIIHEILHIPMTFSGALRNHKYNGGRVDDRTVNKIYKEYQKRVKERIQFLD
ncbi:metallopeptidase [Candidatus Micrarchaeota archaeon]|jgi:predicted metallopeptidase|nr:metallopeptidase [Candidatus Micrarchaeota archaeon]